MDVGVVRKEIHGALSGSIIRPPLPEGCQGR